ncbi:MAG: phage major capsid protein, partial [Janthinobacterium lividum]
MTYETKADPLDASFVAVAAQPDLGAPHPDIALLRGDIDRLSARLGRPPLSGAKADPERTAFTDRYLRQGLDPGTEIKSLSGAVGTDGGVAVPILIDALIDGTLKAMSPMRTIATVVAIGSANY